MTQQREVNVIVSVNDQTTKGKAAVEFWTRRRAFRLGMKWCLAAWSGAILTLPLPGIHFLTVPACLLIGPPLGYVIYRFYFGSAEIASGLLVCPKCGNDWQLSKQTVDFPQVMSCPSCAAEALVSLGT